MRRSECLEGNRAQTEGMERPCQVPVGHESLKADQMPRFLMTLQRVAGHKVKKLGEDERRQNVMLLFGWQRKSGEPWGLI